jgi:hypothetical protein
VLNAHGGPLPPIRGMNASEWALFHGVDPTVTMHLMDTGIDTGPMIMHRPIPTESWRSSIARGRGEAARVGVEGLLDAVDLLAKGTVEPTPQSYGDGRQYFIIADPLLEVLERWIADGRTPVMDAATFRFPAPAADWCKSKQT